IPSYMKWEGAGWSIEEGSAYVYYQERLVIQSVYYIPFKITINALPKTDQIDLYPHITYSYSVGYRSIPKANVIHLKDPMRVQVAIIDKEQTGLIKQVDKKIAQVGDVLSYAVWLTNTGNIPAENVVVKEVFPPELKWVPNEDNIQQGIELGQLRQGEQKVIHYQARVIAMKPSTTLNPSTHIAYGFSVGSQYIERWIESDEVQTTIEMADIQGEMVVNKGVATLEDLLTYTITLRNEGNMPAYDIEVILPVISGCRWTNQSIYIPQLEVGEQVQKNYNLCVESMPYDDQIDAYGQVRYMFKTTVGEEVKRHYTTEHVSTPVIAPQIKVVDEGLQKYVSQQTAVKLEVLTYTLVLKNTGNVMAQKVTIQEELSQGLRLIPKTVTIAGEVSEQETLAMPLVIEELRPGAKTQITYKVKVVDLPEDEEVFSHSRVTYQYVMPYEEEVTKLITEEMMSLPTKVYDPKISTQHGTLKQRVDEDVADLGDYLHYTVTIVNTGNTAAMAPYYQVNLPEGLNYVPKTLKLNGEIIEDTLVRIQLPNLDIEKVCEITFTAVVVTLPMEKVCIAEGRLSYKIFRNEEEVTSITEINESAQTQIDTAGPVKQEDFWQQTSQSVAHLGDMIQSTYKIKNMGNRIMKNAILRLKEDLIHLNMIDEKGECLGDIMPLETKEVTLDMQVVDIPRQSYLGPIGQVDYEYTVGSNLQKKTTKFSNEVTLKIQDTGLQKKGQVVIFVDKEYAQIGEILTYEVHIQNAGNTSALNLTGKIQISDEVEILSESIRVLPKEKAVGKMGAIHIEKIAPEEKVTIVFQAKVRCIPEQEKIESKMSINYGYKDAYQKLQIESVTTNEVITSIRSTDFDGDNFSKTILQEEYTLGEIIHYKIKCLNKGNITAKNVKVIQKCPQGISILVDTVKLENGNRLRCKQGEEILVGDMRPNQQEVIHFEAKVEKLVDLREWVDESCLMYQSETVPLELMTQESQRLGKTLVINAPQFDVQIQMLQEEVLLGETVGIKVRITNIGNQHATDIGLTKLLPPQFVVVPYSIRLDGTGCGAVASLEELRIPQIDREQTITLNISAKVIAQISQEESQLPQITYHFQLRQNTCEMVAKGVPIVLKVHHTGLDIGIQSDQDDKKVQVGDTVNYTVTMTNTGSLKMIQGIIYQELSRAIKFEKGYVMVRGEQVGIQQLEQGINIGDLDVDESLTIHYKTTVMGYYAKALQITARAKYKFMLNQQEVSQSVETAKVVHEIKISSPYMKRVTGKKMFILPVTMSDIKQVDGIKASVKACGIRQIIKDKNEVEVAVQVGYEIDYVDSSLQVQLVRFEQLIIEKLKYTEVKQVTEDLLTVEVEMAQVAMVNQRQMEIWLELAMDL
ncbi:MAG: hypothetical protein ACRCTE_08385, partial [Cellulosilyticaceae bacterium]